MNKIFSATTFAFFVIAGSSSLAQTSDTPKNQDLETQSSDRVSAIDAVEAEYRELICSRAADFSQPDQVQAINIARWQKYVDARFNDVVGRIMRNAAKPNRWDREAVLRSELLLPLTTLNTKERTELVFICVLACGDSKAESSTRKKLQGWLEKEPDETSRLVLLRLSEPDVPASLFSLANITGSSTYAILPLLMKYAKLDDDKISAAAIGVIPDTISSLRKRDERELELKAQTAIESALGEDLDPKFVAYAKRIIEKYDSNDDQILTPLEYRKMLMSPAQADANGDGDISVFEYAAFMQSAKDRRN